MVGVLLPLLLALVTAMEVELTEKEPAVKKEGLSVEVTVIDSARFSMSDVGPATVQVWVDRVEGRGEVQLVAEVSALGSAPLFTSPACLPSLHLVGGQPSCSLLPPTVAARVLAEVTGPGPGDLQVDASWEDFRDSCILLLRPLDCGEQEAPELVEVEGVGDESDEMEVLSGWVDDGGDFEEVERTQVPEEEDEQRVERRRGPPQRGVDWASLQLRRHPRRLLGSAGSLSRPAIPSTRALTPLTLASFTLLSAGTTGYSRLYTRLYFRL